MFENSVVLPNDAEIRKRPSGAVAASMTRAAQHAAAAAERREIIIGHSSRQRLILVAFTAAGTKIRIFSAREATATERKDYEENAES